MYINKAKKSDQGYEIKNGDVYYKSLYICGGSEKLAISYDEKNGTLHRHGNYNSVKEWHDKTSNVLICGGFEEYANSLILISFFINTDVIDELNKCINISGYVSHIQEKLSEINSKYSYH